MVRNQWEPVRAFSPAPARARAFQPCCLLLSPLPFPSLPPVLTPHPPPQMCHLIWTCSTSKRIPPLKIPSLSCPSLILLFPGLTQLWSILWYSLIVLIV